MLCMQKERKMKWRKKRSSAALSSTIQHNCKVWNCIIAQRTPNAIYNNFAKRREKNNNEHQRRLHCTASQTIRKTHTAGALKCQCLKLEQSPSMYSILFSYFCSFFIVFVCAHVGETLVRKWAKWRRKKKRNHLTVCIVSSSTCTGITVCLNRGMHFL